MMDGPETYTVLYNGQSIDLQRVERGYAYLCPAGCCRAYHWFALEGVEKPHKIVSAPGEPLTIEGSLACPCVKGGTKCSWHVWVTNGVAKDA